MTTAAYAHYAHDDFVRAYSAYAAIREKFPADMVAQRILEKCQTAINRSAYKQ